MSDFTIEQLEALKEGATPGPWEAFHETWEEYNPDGDAVLEYEQYGIIGGADGILDTLPVTSLMDAPNQWAESGEHDNAANTRLAAAAPALVDALIAEKRAHAKLRAEVEAMREDWGRKAERSAGARDNSEHPAKAAHARHLKAHQNVIRRLTSILGADNG